VILLAPRPVFSEAFLNLSLVACEAAGIPAIIALNKSDLDEHKAARATLVPWERIGYTVQRDEKTGLVGFSASYNVKGGYEQIRECVGLLEASPQFVLVERIGLRGEESASSLEVAVQLTVGTYFSDVDTGLVDDLGIVEIPEELLAESVPPPMRAAPLPARVITEPLVQPTAPSVVGGPGGFQQPGAPGYRRPPAYVRPVMEKPPPEPVVRVRRGHLRLLETPGAAHDRGGPPAGGRSAQSSSSAIAKRVR